MNFINISIAINIAILAVIKNVLGFIYFCITQIGISIRNATKFQIHKKSHDKRGDSSTNQKKNTIVK
jgi:hypothetical protein